MVLNNTYLLTEYFSIIGMKENASELYPNGIN